MIDVVKNLEAIRLAKNLTQSDVGRKLGVKQTTYSNWMNRSVDIPFGRLSNIADVLGVTVMDIITYPDHYVPEKSITPECEECKRKQKTIDNLNYLIEVLTNKLNRNV